ncbi:hypothetical protein GCM10011350_22870 [Marinomonas arctica]|nr:hypothetical protein GCM10011350_22870 [Marinomonas arctica]
MNLEYSAPFCTPRSASSYHLLKKKGTVIVVKYVNGCLEVKAVDNPNKKNRKHTQVLESYTME